MPYPVNRFSTFAQLLNYINAYWVTNGVQEITGIVGNDVVNGLLTFVEESPLNWQTADIASSGGVVNVTRPITIFMSAVPTSLTWGDNVYNEYVFVNTTLGIIPTTKTYIDINLAAINYIPAKSVVNICKAKNGQWVVKSLAGSGGGGTIKPPLIGVVDGGGPDDPVSGQSLFQNNKLVGLGATNNGKIQISLAETILSNYGDNIGFTLDNVAGEIDISPSKFIAGNSIYVNLNQ